jgi:hypothetical protein
MHSQEFALAAALAASLPQHASKDIVDDEFHRDGVGPAQHRP